MDTLIRPAVPGDLAFLMTHDRHIAPSELDQLIHRGRITIIEAAGEPIGWLRWNLFWDNTPFMNLLYLLDGHRLKGHGRALVNHFEQQMREQGYAAVMTSTQANEAAQHFYRHLGYQDIGGFLLPGEAFELVLHKAL